MKKHRLSSNVDKAFNRKLTVTRTTNNSIGLNLTLCITLIAIGATCYSGSAGAIPKMMKNKISSKFKSADKNADGGLTPAEAKASGMPKQVLSNFDRIDTNKDGMITETEMFTAFDNGAIKR
jgi:hypothetical protein